MTLSISVNGQKRNSRGRLKPRHRVAGRLGRPVSQSIGADRPKTTR